MLNVVRLHLHVYRLLTYCFNKEIHHMNAILPHDWVLYDRSATPQDMVQYYRPVFAPQDINLDQQVLYNGPATPQDINLDQRVLYNGPVTPQDTNLDQQVLCHHPATPQDMVPSYCPVYALHYTNFD